MPFSLMFNAIKRPAVQVALLVAVLCIGLQGFGFDEALRFDRPALQNGKWWLLLTANFVHLNWSHLALNLTGLLLVVLLVWNNFNGIEWATVIILSSMGVGVGLYLLDPNILWYVGFSGTLHGLIIAGTLADIRSYPWQALALLVAVIGKLLWEQLFGAMPGSESIAGGAVLVNSHLYGAIAGAIVGFLLLLRHYLHSKPNR